MRTLFYSRSRVISCESFLIVAVVQFLLNCLFCVSKSRRAGAGTAAVSIGFGFAELSHTRYVSHVSRTNHSCQCSNTQLTRITQIVERSAYCFSLSPSSRPSHSRVPVPPHQHHAPRTSTKHAHTVHESRESHVTSAHIHTHPDSTLRCMLR